MSVRGSNLDSLIKMVKASYKKSIEDGLEFSRKFMFMLIDMWVSTLLAYSIGSLHLIALMMFGKFHTQDQPLWRA